MRRRGTPAAALLGALLAAAANAAVPAGFTDALVAGGLAAPTALAFAPDGRLLVTTQGGTLRVVQNGALVGTPALTIPASQICTDSERGLLGVAVDPAFGCNQSIYLFYTAERPGGSCVNRVSRFTLPASNVVNPASELVLIDNMPSPNGNHNAGDLQFGKDGHLYVSIGEGGIASAARNEHVLTGKILRITPGGGIPADNPFQGAGTARCNVTGSTTPGNRCQETYAWGLRNPFRLGFDPNAAGTRFFVNDVGAGAWEEIDLGQAGADYGWSCREGAHPTGSCPSLASMVDPIFEYAHDQQIPGTTSPASCNCASGGAFVPNGLWPGYDGAYLFGDCTCGGIFRLSQGGGGAWTAADFGSGLGTVVHLLFGPHGATQALYYTTFAGAGSVRRVTLDNPPSAAALRFFSLPPCRLADTRNPPGPSGGPALQACTSRTFAVGGLCGVPAAAKAVALNLTAVGPTGAGHLTAHPAGSLPPATSTLNFAAGQTRANNAVLALGTNGQIAVLPVVPGGGAVHFVADVVGWFE
ncbi:MAG TPA: PQQ-dependent sugar dehydrogenase [Thermoanaerobaculia bacterium]|nr:PQQ-dependent sugar dehydrogenase [Thermoanaerobaculia bacterium]